ncbi:histidine kinase [Streptomyces sp. NPDC051940]|uniref:sensor histidine kinase n=1 Tax=Streptomyces sp. NPDC051940 TaxID=3155675 RepID=UPI003444EE9D
MARTYAMTWRDRPAWARSPVAADVLLWMVITAPVFTSDGLPGAAQAAGLPMRWVQLAAVPLLALAVAAARRHPVGAAAVPAGLGLAATPELFTNNYLLAQLVLAFLMGRRTAGMRPGLVFAGAVCLAGLVLSLAVPGLGLATWFTVVATVLMTIVLPWLAGRYVRQHDELVRTGWELAERLEREQDLIGDRVRLLERSRIAGDMHDSLGHELSLIALRAAALQVDPGLSGGARDSAGELRESAAAATERLREIIGVLREDGAAAPVLPSGDTVADLVRRAAASGMEVSLAGSFGGPAGSSGERLPPMADRAVYRVVQEALTNATKYAPGAAVTVTLSRDETADEALVTVVNAAPPAGPLPSAAGSGYGLVGLDERVRLAGGRLAAHPVPGEGFTVTARLPLTAGAAVAPPGPRRSQQELARARRRVRRSMLDAIWVPLAAAVALLLLMFGFNTYTSYRSVLPESVYADLRVGQPLSSFEDRLPRYEADDNERPTGAPPDPRGADECRFYRTRTFSLDPAYRLCLRDGRLASKDVVRIVVR